MKEELQFHERVKLFMKAMNDELELKPSGQLRFCDLDSTIHSCSKVYSWFYRQVYKNLDLLLIECQKYRDIYPIAYQRINAKIEKIQSSLPRKKKIELIMMYIEQHDIPNGRCHVRFCDIDKTVNDTAVVGFFIQTNLEYNEALFFTECIEYKNKYPIAFRKIETKIEKRHTFNVQKERVRIYMEYINRIPNVSISDNVRFCDIDKNCVDNVKVVSWIQSQLSLNISWFKEEYVKYKELYQEAYCKIHSRIIALESKRTISPLCFSKRVEVVMNYLEKKEISQIDKTTTFHEIYSNTDDSTLVRLWIINQFGNNMEVFMDECTKYKEVYPKGYQKLLLRKGSFQEESNRLLNYLSFEKKMELFMRYLEYDFDINDVRNLKFSDLDATVNDESSVRNWFVKNLSSDLSRFIEEYSKYQENYPNAYKKITEKINCSKVRITKERLLLIEKLKQIKDCLEKEEKCYGFSKSKSLQK